MTSLAAVVFVTDVATARADTGFNPIDVGIGQLQAVAALLAGGSRDKIVPGSPGDFSRLAGDLFAAADPRAQGTVDAGDPAWLRVSLAGDRTRTADADLWGLASGHPRETFDVPRLGVEVAPHPRVRLAVGYSQAARGDTRLYTGSTAVRVWPAAAPAETAIDLRASYAQVTGVRHLTLDSQSAEALVSRTWGRVLGYAGAGVVHGEAHLGSRFDYDARQTLGKFFAGGEAVWGGARVTAEVGITGDRPWQALRVSMGF